MSKIVEVSSQPVSPLGVGVLVEQRVDLLAHIRVRGAQPLRRHGRGSVNVVVARSAGSASRRASRSERDVPCFRLWIAAPINRRA
jgi:hypothetical protein